MNISTHSVSENEQALQTNEWRIVVLMRNISSQNIAAAKQLFEKR